MTHAPRTLTACTVALMPLAALADNLAGADRLLCSPAQVSVCDANECEAVVPWDLKIPNFVQIDLKKKILTTPPASAERRQSPIATVLRVQGRIILQGSENGRSYSMSIDEQSGLSTMAIAVDERTVSIFGACTPLP